jgi:hypothetical protein
VNTMTQPGPGMVRIYRPATGAVETVTVPEAARAMIAWAARTYGQGTPGFATVVMIAVDLLASSGCTLAEAGAR